MQKKLDSKVGHWVSDDDLNSDGRSGKLIMKLCITMCRIIANSLFLIGSMQDSRWKCRALKWLLTRYLHVNRSGVQEALHGPLWSIKTIGFEGRKLVYN